MKKYVQNWIKSGLIDWDITRDIPWGVPVPLDDADELSAVPSPVLFVRPAFSHGVFKGRSSI